MSVATKISQVSKDTAALNTLKGEIILIREQGSTGVDEVDIISSTGCKFKSKEAFIVTLRDTESPDETINVYFFDDMDSDKNLLRVGRTLTVSGPSSMIGKLSSPDGDGNNYCLIIFRKIGNARGKRKLGVGNDSLSVIVNDETHTYNLSSGHCALEEKSRKMQKKTNKCVEYLDIKSVYNLSYNDEKIPKIHIYGVISTFGHAHKTTKDYIVTIKIVDKSISKLSEALTCNIFADSPVDLPGPILLPGDVVRLHRCSLNYFLSSPQLCLNCNIGSWVVVRSKIFRSAALKVASQNACNSEGNSTLDSPESKERGIVKSRNRKFPQAEANVLLPPQLWECSPSSKCTSFEESDAKMCMNLFHWFWEQSKCTPLSFDAAPAVEQNMFCSDGKMIDCASDSVELMHRLPTKYLEQGPLKDLVGVVADIAFDECNKMKNLLIWDGSGDGNLPSASIDSIKLGLNYAYKVRGTDATASEIYGSTLSVAVNEYCDVLTEIGISAGMWVRLKKIKLLKGLENGQDSLQVIFGTCSSLNVLHPSMFEVKKILDAYEKRVCRPNCNLLTSHISVNQENITLKDMKNSKKPITGWVKVIVANFHPQEPAKFIHKVKSSDKKSTYNVFLYLLMLKDKTDELQALVSDKGTSSFIAPDHLEICQSEKVANMIRYCVATGHTVNLRVRAYYQVADGSTCNTEEALEKKDMPDINKRYIVIGGSLW